MSNILKFKFIFLIFCLCFVLFCGKKEKTKTILLNLDEELVFSSVKFKKVFKRSYFMEIDLIPFEDGLIIGKQKNNNGIIEKYDFKGNLLFKKTLDIGGGIDKITNIAGCFYDTYKKKIFEFKLPYIKEISDKMDYAKNVKRINLEYHQLGVGIRLYSPPLSLSHEKMNFLFRFKDITKTEKNNGWRKENYGICRVSKDFKNFKILRSFNKKEKLKSKIINVDYYYHKQHVYFPIIFDNNNKKVYVINDLWSPEFFRIDTKTSTQEIFRINLKKKAYSDSDIYELNEYFKWLMSEVMPKRVLNILRRDGIKHVKKIRDYKPFFENILLYKKYLLLFSGEKDFKANVTTVYAFDKDSMKYLGKMSFPYSGDYYNNSFIFNNYYVDVTMKYVTENTIFEVNVYKLEI